MKLTNQTRKRIHLVAGIAVSLALVAAGVLLCIACLGIYRSDTVQMYTYERIGAAFARISLPIYLALLIIAAGTVIGLAVSPSPEAAQTVRGKRALRRALANKADPARLPAESALAIKRERRLRGILTAVNTALFVAEATLPLLYLLDPDNFLGTTSQECTKEVVRCMLVYVGCLLPLLIYETVYLSALERSDEREIALLKQAIREHGIATPKSDEKTHLFAKCTSFLTRHEVGISWCLRGVILLAAGILILLGIKNGGMSDVLKKAAEICAECIGLG